MLEALIIHDPNQRVRNYALKVMVNLEMLL